MRTGDVSASQSRYSSGTSSLFVCSKNPAGVISAGICLVENHSGQNARLWLYLFMARFQSCIGGSFKRLRRSFSSGERKLHIVAASSAPSQKLGDSMTVKYGMRSFSAAVSIQIWTR
ncbi:hypothetical protein D3C84_744930 [compost metagenome]